MHRIVVPCAIFAIMSLMQSPLVAQPVQGNPASGLRVATTICGNCHSVTSTMPSSPVAAAPSFDNIANRPMTSELSLKRFLRSNHSRMPQFMLSRADADDVIAYILSLKRN